MITFVRSLRTQKIKSLLMLAITLLTLSTPSAIYAQEICNALLSGGVFDEFLVSDERAMASYMRSRFCSSESSSGSGSLTVPIAKLPTPVGFSFEQSSESNVCNDRESSQQSWSAYLSWAKTASPILAKSFVDCINSQGLRIWVERTAAPDRFRLRVRLKIDAEKIPPATVQIGFTPEDNIYNCGLPIERLKKGSKIENLGTENIACSLHNPSLGVDVSLSTKGHFPQVDGLEIAPLRIAPIFALANREDPDGLNGVEVPTPGDATFGWSPASDTLINQYNGAALVSPVGSRRWAYWDLAGIQPGRYEVMATFASGFDHSPRPLDIFVGDSLELAGEGSEEAKVGWAPTGGWSPGNRLQRSIGSISIPSAAARLRLQASSDGQHWPHFHALRLIYSGPIPGFDSPEPSFGR